MEKEIILTTAASYQNRDGILTLSPRKLQWSVQGEKSPIIDTAISEIKNFFVGKPNALEAKFKFKCIDYNNQEMAHTIILKSQSAWKDLETIKAQVAPSPAPQRSAAASPMHHKSAAPSPASGGSSPAVWNNNLQQNKNSTTTNSRNGALSLRKPTAKEINLRKSLLMRDKKLADQHRILVVEQRCIAEEEFWELRKNLLRDQDTRTSQQKGRSSTMPNLRPVTEEGGEAKINITPQLINEIFEEYPRVKIAYDKNVPNKISEEVFWKRYVHSKFNDRNRTTSVVNDDIFDKCWAETEDDLNQEREHGRKRLKISNLRDLSATKEDHIEIDFAPDVTMRSSQGKILSLLRRNNRHAERILEAACEKSRRYKETTTQLQEKEDYTENILMDDLIEEEPPSTYKLDITDQREYFASQVTEIDNDTEMVDSEQSFNKQQSSILNKFRESFKGWNPNLTEPLFPKNHIPNLVTKKCNEMIEDKQNRVKESKPKIENLPQKIEKEVNIIQLMGNEFLRHFWASVDSANKEKVEKNKRIIEQLKSILTKIDQVSEMQPPDDDNNQGSGPNGVSNISQKSQRLDKEQRLAINGKRKIGSKTSGGSFENRPDSSGSSEWKDALIQAQQMLNPLSVAIKRALAHNQGVNISRPNSRQGRISSSDHNKPVSRDSKTIPSPEHYKNLPRDTNRDIKQPQHHGTQKTKQVKQVSNLKNQKSNKNDTSQISSQEVQRPSNRQNGASIKQDTNRVNHKVPARNITQTPDINREAVPSRTKNIQQNTSRRDDLQPNGRDTHPHVAPKSSNVAPSGSPTQISSVNRTKSSTKRKR